MTKNDENILIDSGIYVNFYDENIDNVEVEKAKTAYIHKRDEEGYQVLGHFSVTLPKNKSIVTAEWIMDKVAKKENEKRINFRELFHSVGIATENCSFYSTSYGFGMFSLFGRDNKKAEEISQYLTSKGVEFRNEWSDARWVFRFVISKKSGNMEKLLK